MVSSLRPTSSRNDEIGLPEASVVLLALALGCAIRFARLSHVLVSSDEADFYVYAVKMAKGSLFATSLRENMLIRAVDFSQGFLSCVVPLLGVTVCRMLTGRVTEAALLYSYAGFALLKLVPVYLLCNRLAGVRVGLYAVAFVAVMPGEASLNRFVAGPQNLGLVFALFALHFLWVSLEDGDPTAGILCSMSLGLYILSSYNFPLLLPILLGACWLAAARCPQAAHRPTWRVALRLMRERILKPWFLVCPFVALALVVGVWAARSQLGVGMGGIFGHLVDRAAGHGSGRVARLTYGWRPIPIAFLYNCGPAILGVAVAGLVELVRRPKWRDGRWPFVLWFACFGLPYLLLLPRAIQLMDAMVALPVIGAFFIGAGQAIRGRAAAVAAALCTVVVSAAAASFVTFQAEQWHKLFPSGLATGFGSVVARDCGAKTVGLYIRTSVPASARVFSGFEYPNSILYFGRNTNIVAEYDKTAEELLRMFQKLSFAPEVVVLRSGQLGRFDSVLAGRYLEVCAVSDGAGPVARVFARTPLPEQHLATTEANRAFDDRFARSASVLVPF